SDSGAIVGYYFDANGLSHGFLLSGGQYATLDDPAGALGTGVTGINDRGQITGAYIDANGLQHGFLFSGGQSITIDAPGGVLGSATDSVNTAGNLVGVYTAANGVIHGYLATKVHGNPAAYPAAAPREQNDQFPCG